MLNLLLIVVAVDLNKLSPVEQGLWWQSSKKVQISLVCPTWMTLLQSCRLRRPHQYHLHQRHPPQQVRTWDTKHFAMHGEAKRHSGPDICKCGPFWTMCAWLLHTERGRHFLSLQSWTLLSNLRPARWSPYLICSNLCAIKWPMDRAWQLNTATIELDLIALLLLG